MLKVLQYLIPYLARVAYVFEEMAVLQAAYTMGVGG